jgi:hypothetical protein
LRRRTRDEDKREDVNKRRREENYRIEDKRRKGRESNRRQERDLSLSILIFVLYWV